MSWLDPHDRYPDPSPSEFSRWLSAEEAFGHLPNGLSQTQVNRLIQRLQDASLVAAATEVRWRAGGKIEVRHRITIDPAWWLNAQDAQTYSSALWSLSEVTCRIPDEAAIEVYMVNFYGVRFEYAGIYDAVPGLRVHHQAMLATREALDRAPPKGVQVSQAPPPITPVTGYSGMVHETPTAPVKRSLTASIGRGAGFKAGAAIQGSASSKRLVELEEEVAILRRAAVNTSSTIDIDAMPNKGGRPSADFWIDMSLEIARRIHFGEFKPKTKSDVVDAMQRWILDRGFTGGLTRTKECADKVFKLFKD